MKLSLDSMSERERRMVMISGLVAVLVLVFGVLVPLDRSVSQTRARISRKQADLVWMKRVAPVLAEQGAMQTASSGESLIVIVDRSAKESGLGKSLAGTDPSGAGGVQVRLEKASFDAMVGWLSRLSQQNGVRVDGATLDAAGTPGLVNAAVVLHSR